MGRRNCMIPTIQYGWSIKCTSGEGNGNPLQCSCLKNPTDRGAWPAAVHGVSRATEHARFVSSLGDH